MQVAGPAGVVHDPVLAVADPRLRPLPLLHHRGHAAAEARRHQLRQGGTRPPQVGVQGQTKEMYCVNIYSGSSRSNELSTTAKFLTSTSNPASCAININYCAGDHFSKVLYSLFWPILLLLPILEKKMLRPKNSNVNSTSRRQDNTRVTIRSSQDAPFKTSVNATAL